jgi:putative N6-adenine-specific DNA methylase
MEWPAFNREAWETLFSEIPQAHRIPSRQIRASDRDAGAIRAAQANAERAGVFDCIDFSCHAVSSIDPPPGPGWVVTNPPYGKRTETNQDLRNLYAQFGKVLRARCPGWRVAALCTSVQLLRCTELEWDQGIPFINGGIRVRLVRGTVAPGQP